MKHGHCKDRKHRTKEYRAWAHMISRCYNTNVCNYHRYGGRGIFVCKEWRNSFITFLHDIGYAPTSKHSLDRINNNGNYEPNNVKWSTNSEQIKNSTKARLLTLNNKTLNIVDWEKRIGIDHRTIQMRIDAYGWSVKKALTTPIRRKA